MKENTELISKYYTLLFIKTAIALVLISALQAWAILPSYMNMSMFVNNLSIFGWVLQIGVWLIAPATAFYTSEYPVLIQYAEEEEE